MARRKTVALLALVVARVVDRDGRPIDSEVEAATRLLAFKLGTN